MEKTKNLNKLLKPAIEIHCGLKVFGYIPKDDELKLESRHLGLVQSVEVGNLNKKINYLSEVIEKYINLDEIIESFKEVKCFEDNYHLSKSNKRIAIAFDEAFRFYYKENLELLEEAGDVVYFSPLRDKKLPEDIDFLYLGGGYPEVFKETLSKNTEMLSNIKEALDNGLKCYAECGGLMYLTGNIDNVNMVGFLNGNRK